MKTTFTKNEIISKRGCYSREQVENLSFINKRKISIKTILKSKISIRDKRWFVYNACNLTLNEQKELSLLLAWAVLPIYEQKYPNDSRVRDCLQAIEDYNSGKISIETLTEKRSLAAAADTAAADTADTAAAYIAAAAAADAADAATAAAAAAAAAADTAAVYIADTKLTYSTKIQQVMIKFVK